MNRGVFGKSGVSATDQADTRSQTEPSFNPQSDCLDYSHSLDPVGDKSSFHLTFKIGGVGLDDATAILFGIPNEEEKRVDYAIEIPKLSSLILKHDLNAPLDGLDTIPDEEEPPVAIVFYSFRVMLAIGFAMLSVGLWSLVQRVRGRLNEDRWLHCTSVLLAPSGFVAVLAGWITTEMGRQPYTVYGLMRTSDSLSQLDAPTVAASLIAFIVVYFAVFGAGTFYMLRLMAKPPAESFQKSRKPIEFLTLAEAA